MTFFEALWRALNQRQTKEMLKADSKTDHRFPALTEFLEAFSGQAQLWEKAQDIYMDMATSPSQLISPYSCLIKMFGGEEPYKYGHGETRSKFFELKEFCDRATYHFYHTKELQKIASELSILAQQDPAFEQFLTWNMSNDAMLLSIFRSYGIAYRDEFLTMKNCTLAQAAAFLAKAQKDQDEARRAHEQARQDARARELAAIQGFSAEAPALAAQIKMAANKHGISYDKAFMIINQHVGARMQSW